MEGHQSLGPAESIPANECVDCVGSSEAAAGFGLNVRESVPNLARGLIGMIQTEQLPLSALVENDPSLLPIVTKVLPPEIDTSSHNDVLASLKAKAGIYITEETRTRACQTLPVTFAVPQVA